MKWLFEEILLGAVYDSGSQYEGNTVNECHMNCPGLLLDFKFLNKEQEYAVSQEFLIAIMR